jgi:hypothetical protein
MAVEGGVARELAAAVEGDGSAGVLGQRPEGAGDAGEDRGGAPVVVRQKVNRLVLSSNEVTSGRFLTEVRRLPGRG